MSSLIISEDIQLSTDAVGVLFDVDGTLVDTTYVHTVAWWEALHQAQLYVPMAQIHEVNRRFRRGVCCCGFSVGPPMILQLGPVLSWS